MGILTSILTVLFFILCLLLIIIILLQSDKSAGMGILGGSSQTTFGSSTADVITKITAVMTGLFMVGSLGLSAIEAYRAREFDPNTAKVRGGVERPVAPAERSEGAEKQGVGDAVKADEGAGKDLPATEKNVMKERESGRRDANERR